MIEKDYYLGLDMGTSSVGWACTDEEYNLIRAKGKDLWGIREFEEAKTSAERRSFRTSRRRKQREKVRIRHIREYFSDEISKVDSNFYARLDNSKYIEEDKQIEDKSSNILFNDPDFKDKDYYEKYPTIFHLRKELIASKEPHDVRLVYLAVLNMFKHRGHFLYANLSTDKDDDGQNIKEVYDKLANAWNEMLTQEEESVPNANNLEMPSIAVDKAKEIEDVLSSKKWNRTGKAEKVAELLGINLKKDNRYIIVKGFCGLKVDVKTLFNLDIEEKLAVDFTAGDYDEKVPEIMDAVGEEKYQIVELVKNIYDIGTLASIMKGHKYLSEARVEEYEKHGRDLKILKNIYKKYANKDVYEDMFRSDKPGSYSSYVNSVNSSALSNNGKSGKSRRNMKDRTKEAIYKKINSDLDKMKKNYPEASEDKNMIYVLEQLDKDSFLPKQLTSANGVIPNQIHAKELKKILKNAEEYLPFLKEKDESNLTISQRILKLFSFRVPYYVGPTSENSEKNKGNGWVVRKEEGEVLPWNIDDKIDMEKTSEKFITKLIKDCTYLSGEKVMPKASLMYEKYMVLNEINNIKINKEDISVELKQDIFNDLYLSGKRVTKRRLINYLKNRGLVNSGDEISGIDINLNNQLVSYGRFLPIFGEELKNDNCKKAVESIIYWSTIYGDSKKMLKEVLLNEVGDYVNNDNIKRIMGLRFKDWGNLSKEFLELEGVNKETGEISTIIKTLWETNYNLMQIINGDEFDYKEILEEKRNKGLKVLSEITIEDLDDMYFSAPVKRMVWQTLKVIKELVKVTGKEPKKVFVEMTRAHDKDPKRTDSRKKELLELYKSIKDESENWKDLIERADANGKLKSKKMYLYLLQMGKDMYTGERIELDDLFNDNKYDIDHIYPQHFVKDDNLRNNLVLVNKTNNIRKSDTYPIDSSIRNNNKVKELWDSLREKRLINEEKYKRLTGNTPFSDEQLAGFIARQLVETSQGTKGVTDIIKSALKDSEIIYAKAENVSEFRKKFKMYKSRSVNDFHHANDAYLNIVVGNVYNMKFTTDPRNYIKNYQMDKEEYEYHLGRMFYYDVKRKGKVAWIAERKKDENGNRPEREDGLKPSIHTVRRVMDKNTPMLTRMTFTGHGGIAKQMPYGKDKVKDKGYIPLKTSDVRMKNMSQYGGFDKPSTAYFTLVEYKKKGKLIRSLEAIPVYMKERIENNPEELEPYIKDVFKGDEKIELDSVSIRYRKIKLQSLVKYNGYFVYITGKTGNQLTLRNATSMCVSREKMNYIKKIDKYIDKQELDIELNIEKNIELYDYLKNKHMNSIFSKRLNPVGEKLEKGREKFIKLSIEDQITVLNQIIQLSSIGIPRVNLTLIGESANTGIMLMNKEITTSEEMMLINQSITGLYTDSIDLKII